MCIICNCVGNEEAADDYLGAVERARRAMLEAEAALLRVSQVCLPDRRQQYDAAHKRLVRARREWNKAESQRETPGAK